MARAALPPLPLRLQLIAIVRDGEAFKAAVYDPDADRILVVAVGDSIAGRTVEQVRSADVTVRDGTRSRLLSLRTDGVSP